MENKKYIVSFPHIGNYYIPIYNLLTNILDMETTSIMIPKKISKNTIQEGGKYSPDYVCTPFKYNLGNFIESLESGANVIIQAGGGCRYGYYAEVQEQILRDLGYDFKYITLCVNDGLNLNKVYQKFKSINPKLTLNKLISKVILALRILILMDKFDEYARENMVYEKNPGEMKKLQNKFLMELKKVKNLRELSKIYKNYINKLKRIELDKSKELLKIGIVGELFSSMEPFSSFFIEEKLTNMGVKVKRYTTATYLLFQKAFNEKKLLKEANGYIEYALGADGTESVAHSLELIKNGYDGIIHIKPFGCTPEINAMPILQKISNDSKIPIIYLTFDLQTSEAGINTRIEAFYDMLQMKKEKKVI